MNRIQVFPLFTLVCSMSTFANEPKVINESDLYGNWNCKHEMENSNTKMKMKINYDVNSIRNGKSTGFGTLLFNLPNFPELEYSLADSSTWEIKDGYLISSSTEIKLANVSHPELEKFLHLEKLIPQHVSVSAKILDLTRTNLKVLSESDGAIYTCSKIAIKS